MINSFSKNKQTHTKPRSAFPLFSLGARASKNRGPRPTLKRTLQVYV